MAWELVSAASGGPCRGAAVDGYAAGLSPVEGAWLVAISCHPVAAECSGRGGGVGAAQLAAVRAGAARGGVRGGRP